MSERAMRRAGIVRLANGLIPVVSDMATGTGGGKDQIDRLQDSLVDFLIDAGVPSEVARATQSALRSQQAQTAIHKRVEREIEALVVSELAKRADEIEERVRGAINERLEEVVASTARRLLEDELEKVRRRFQ